MISTTSNSTQSVCNSLIPSWQTISIFSCSKACGMWCTWYKSNAEIVKSWYHMASIHSTSWRKQCRSFSTSSYIIGRITTVSLLMDIIIPWLTTRTVIYPRYRSCLPAQRCTMLPRSGQRTKGFIRKLPRKTWSGHTWSLGLLQLKEWQESEPILLRCASR